MSESRIVTQPVTFEWWVHHWESGWANSPDEVPEWDVSRIEHAFARAWAKTKAEGNPETWPEFRDQHQIVVGAALPQWVGYYPRLVAHPTRGAKPVTRHKKEYNGLLKELLRISGFLGQDALTPGSEAQRSILTLANLYSPYSHTLKTPIPHGEPAGALSPSLRFWASGTLRIRNAFDTIKVMDAELEFGTPRDAMATVKAFVDKQAEIERAQEGDWNLTAWREIQPPISRCTTPREIRRALADYLTMKFGMVGEIQLVPLGEKGTSKTRLVLSATRGVVDWAYFLAAEAILDESVRPCARLDCPKFLTDRTKKARHCSDACKQAVYRERKKRNPVTNL